MHLECHQPAFHLSGRGPYSECRGIPYRMSLAQAQWLMRRWSLWGCTVLRTEWAGSRARVKGEREWPVPLSADHPLLRLHATTRLCPESNFEIGLLKVCVVVKQKRTRGSSPGVNILHSRSGQTLAGHGLRGRRYVRYNLAPPNIRRCHYIR